MCVCVCVRVGACACTRSDVCIYMHTQFVILVLHVNAVDPPKKDYLFTNLDTIKTS